MAKKKLSYREAQDELQNIVAKIEGKEIEIDELSEVVERASFLLKYCKDKLKFTEDKLNQTLEEMD